MNTRPNDNELIRAYIDRTLAEPALGEFELRLLQEPALQEQIDMELALRHGLREFGRAESVPVLARTAKPRAATNGGQARPRWMALAASFFAGAVLPAMLLVNLQSAPPEAVAFQPLGNVPTLLIDPVRSANTDVVLVVAPNASLLLLQVPVYPEHENERYSLRIEREDGVPVAELDELVPDADDLISALVSASMLPSGRYRLDLQSRHAGAVGEQRHIVLRVTAMG